MSRSRECTTRFLDRAFGLLLRSTLVASMSMLASSSGGAQTAYYDRNEVPGTYTVGFYADEQGRSRELKLDKGEDRFELFIGVTGDSTKIFSALVFRMELPPDVRADGPIRWAPIPGLKQLGSPTEHPGAQIEFNVECQAQRGSLPLILGRIPLRVTTDFKKAVIAPQPHVSFGLSLELCQGDKAWPKPYADPLPLTVERKRSWWERITGLFR